MPLDSASTSQSSACDPLTRKINLSSGSAKKCGTPVFKEGVMRLGYGCSSIKSRKHRVQINLSTRGCKEDLPWWSCSEGIQWFGKEGAVVQSGGVWWSFEAPGLWSFCSHPILMES